MNSIQTLIGIQEKGSLKKERKRNRNRKKGFFKSSYMTSEQTPPSSDNSTQGPVSGWEELNHANQENFPL